MLVGTNRDPLPLCLNLVLLICPCKQVATQRRCQEKGELLMGVGRLGGQRWSVPASRELSHRQDG